LRKRGDDGRRCTSLGVDRGIQGADPKVVGGWYRGQRAGRGENRTKPRPRLLEEIQGLEKPCPERNAPRPTLKILSRTPQAAERERPAGSARRETRHVATSNPSR